MIGELTSKSVDVLELFSSGDDLSATSKQASTPSAQRRFSLWARGNEERAMVDGLMLWSFPSHQDFCFPQEPKSIRDDEAAVGLSPSPEDRKAMIDRGRKQGEISISDT